MNGTFPESYEPHIKSDSGEYTVSVVDSRDGSSSCHAAMWADHLAPHYPRTLDVSASGTVFQTEPSTPQWFPDAGNRLL